MLYWVQQPNIWVFGNLVELLHPDWAEHPNWTYNHTWVHQFHLGIAPNLGTAQHLGKVI